VAFGLWLWRLAFGLSALAFGFRVGSWAVAVASGVWALVLASGSGSCFGYGGQHGFPPKKHNFSKGTVFQKSRVSKNHRYPKNKFC
jgi:hypothetical protein